MTAPVPMAELIEIVKQAGVLKRMGEQRCRCVVVDYSPARTLLALPREPDAIDVPVEPLSFDAQTLTFTLEDTMFGGQVWVALVCSDRVVINPFLWKSYEHLTTITLAG